jgi:hypothetical protein
MANSKLLKEAIADAKAVKETALANAKIALEEAFTPRLQSILSQKLRAEAEEVENDDAEKMQEELDSSDIGASDGKEPSGFDANTDLSVGVKSKGGQVGSELSDYKKVKDLNEEEDAMDGDKDAEIAELKARLAELEGEDGEDEMDMSDEFSMDNDMEDDGEDYDVTGDEMEVDDEDEDEDDMDLEAIIRELEQSMNDGDDSEKEEGMYEAEDEKEMDAKNENLADGSEAGTDKGEDPKVVVTNEEEDKEDVIDLEEILREMEADMKDDKEKVDEEEDKEEMKKDLQEAYKTIKSLQNTINEVNLLNAKLLFANKLFRAHNMTNEQKVKVIETLDRTKSVREVKLVYSTLAENFKYSSNKVAKKSITEGIASKVVKSTKPAAQKQVIAESVDYSNRFKKLSGIIK